MGFDDDLYVYQNPQVRGGLTWAGLRWALSADLLFESPNADYWMPVTILTRMLDVELFGLDPAGHHGTNVLLHALNAVLVFLLLEGLTGAAYRSALAAAVLAVHPLTVESVAWVTERKDVLSGVFWALSLMAYGRYATRRSRTAYVLALVFLCLGLMTKPTLAVLPAVLLVLDFWPLGRWRRPSDIGALLLEKAPFLALALASGGLTVLAHSRGGHLASADTLPLELRLANALWSPVVYLQNVVWPTGLAVLLPASSRAARERADGRLPADPGRDFLAGRGPRADATLSPGGLALVPDRPRTGPRPDPDRRPGVGRPLHVHAPRGGGNPSGLGWSRHCVLESGRWSVAALFRAGDPLHLGRAHAEPKCVDGKTR